MKPQLSLEAFTEFCERKPADEKYDYYSVHECALCQFAKSLGLSTALADGQGIYINSRPDDGRRVEILNGPEDKRAAEWPWTFGALAARLRATS